MREIKFRAWDKKSEYMYDPDDNNMEMFMYLDGLLYYDGDPTENYILMQYTGLKDKNGKEIYEGDIVKAKLNGSFIGVVVYERGSFKIEEKMDIKNRPYILLEQWNQEDWKTTEVLGNIYENPELIE